jgi:hypothetical protein
VSDAYSRLYHRFKREFPAIYEDDHAFATWARLLMLADASWPMDPPLPRSVRARALLLLTDAGLLVVEGDCYRMRGLEAERTRRQETARNAAAVRWQNESNASAVPRREEKNKDETSNGAEHESLTGYDGRDDLEAFLLVTRRAPTDRQRKLLDDVLLLHDLSGPNWAAQIILSNPADPIGAVIKADKEWREERVAAAKSQEHQPAKRSRKGTGMTGVNAELAKYYRELESARETEDEVQV